MMSSKTLTMSTSVSVRRRANLALPFFPSPKHRLLPRSHTSNANSATSILSSNMPRPSSSMPKMPSSFSASASPTKLAVLDPFDPPADSFTDESAELGALDSRLGIAEVDLAAVSPGRTRETVEEGPRERDKTADEAGLSVAVVGGIGRVGGARDPCRGWKVVEGTRDDDGIGGRRLLVELLRTEPGRLRGVALPLTAFAASGRRFGTGNMGLVESNRESMTMETKPGQLRGWLGGNFKSIYSPPSPASRPSRTWSRIYPPRLVAATRRNPRRVRLGRSGKQLRGRPS